MLLKTFPTFRYIVAVLVASASALALASTADAARQGDASAPTTTQRKDALEQARSAGYSIKVFTPAEISPNQLKGLTKVLDSAFGTTDPAEMRDAKDNASTLFALASAVNGQIVGAVLSNCADIQSSVTQRFESERHIALVAVAAGHGGKKLAQAMLLSIFEKDGNRPAYLITGWPNTAARRAYEAVGFKNASTARTMSLKMRRPGNGSATVEQPLSAEVQQTEDAFLAWAQAKSKSPDEPGLSALFLCEARTRASDQAAINWHASESQAISSASAALTLASKH